MILLRIWVGVSIIVVRILDLNLSASKKLNFWILRLLRAVIIFFLINTIIGLYFRFEISLVPIFMIIIGWGYQPERFQARIRILIYTLISSLPLLAMLRILYIKTTKSELITLNMCSLNEIFFIFSTIAFLVKTPMFLVHLWLPKAHVEAPVFGSMLLAAILLKLGTYGFLILRCLNSPGIIFIYIFSISFFSSALVSVSCIRIIDMKIIIAYSSVSHMALIIRLIYLTNKLSFARALGIILAHGFRSGGLFYISFLQYARTHSRALLLNKSTLSYIPGLTLSWFLLIMLNIAAPPTLNLMVELIIILNLLRFLKGLSLFLLIYIMARTVYSLILFSRTQQTSGASLRRVRILTYQEYLRNLVYLIPGLILLLVRRTTL